LERKYRDDKIGDLLNTILTCYIL